MQLNEALKHDPALERDRLLCLKVTGFCFLERHPLLSGAPAAPGDLMQAPLLS